MDSINKKITISNHEPFLHNHNDQQQEIKNLKIPLFFFIFFILLIAIALTTIFTRMCNNQKPEQLDAYLSGSSKYFCHLTPYPKLCYHSMSSIIINSTILQFSPDPIFNSSLKIAINQLNATTIAIAKALSSPASNSPLVGPRLSRCSILMHDSLSRLNRSLGLLDWSSDTMSYMIESLTYTEMDNFRAWGVAASDGVGKCFLALEEIDDMMMIKMEGDGEKMMGVEEVKMGVDKANKLIAISICLFDKRDSILHDFYNPYIGYTDYDYQYYYCYTFDYNFLICLYFVMYLMLGVLYFLFLKSN